MSSQHNSAFLEVKLLQRNKSIDLNVMLLDTFYRMKFEENFENVLGENEVYDKATVIKFERDFMSKCFYCGCINEQSGVELSNFIIRKASLLDLFRQIKQRFRDKNELKLATLTIIRAVLNGLKPQEHIWVYDDDKGLFTRLSYSVTDEIIMSFIESLKIFDFYSSLIYKSSKRPDSFNDLYEAIKKQDEKNTNVKFFYTINSNTCPKISSNNYEIVFCKKEHRKTYSICATTSFVKMMKNKACGNDGTLRNIYDFVGL